MTTHYVTTAAARAALDAYGFRTEVGPSTLDAVADRISVRYLDDEQPTEVVVADGEIVSSDGPYRDLVLVALNLHGVITETERDDVPGTER